MYISENNGLGDYTPWRVKVGLRAKPQVLRFLSLDDFDFNQSSLKQHHMGTLDHILVKTVEASWKTMQPIDLIRLIGHTDGTGPETYNAGLGDRRARAVEDALQMKLKGFMKRVAIVVEPSPGATKPTASNRTAAGRKRNRRVDVFITSGGLPLPPKPIDLILKDLPKEGVMEAEKRRREAAKKYWGTTPESKKQSLKEQVRQRLREERVPEGLIDQIFKKAELGGRIAAKAVMAGATISAAARDFVTQALGEIYSWKF